MEELRDGLRDGRVGLLARERDRHERRELALGAQHPHEQLVPRGQQREVQRARALVSRARGERRKRCADAEVGKGKAAAVSQTSVCDPIATTEVEIRKGKVA